MKQNNGIQICDKFISEVLVGLFWITEYVYLLNKNFKWFMQIYGLISYNLNINKKNFQIWLFSSKIHKWLHTTLGNLQQSPGLDFIKFGCKG
jgi:hypothetical protein